jgi:hypothetical protein
MPQLCGDRARAAWAMLTRSFGAGEAPGEAARRDPDDAAEVPVELALVVEADRLRRLRHQRAALEQLLGPGDPHMGQVLVGRQPDLGAEGAHQVELVEPGVLGEVGVQSWARRRARALLFNTGILVGQRGAWAHPNRAAHAEGLNYLSAMGSSTESAAMLDVCLRRKLITDETHRKGKQLLDRIVAMLTKLSKTLQES